MFGLEEPYPILGMNLVTIMSRTVDKDCWNFYTFLMSADILIRAVQIVFDMKYYLCTNILFQIVHSCQLFFYNYAQHFRLIVCKNKRGIRKWGKKWNFQSFSPPSREKIQKTSFLDFKTNNIKDHKFPLNGPQNHKSKIIVINSQHVYRGKIFSSGLNANISWLGTWKWSVILD